MPRKVTVPPDERTRQDEPVEGAYESVALREVWGLLSLGLFVLSLATRLTARALPDEIPGWGRLPPDPFLAVVLIPFFSILGLAFALLAGRRTSATGRAGYLLNLCVLGLSLLFMILVVVWRLSR